MRLKSEELVLEVSGVKSLLWDGDDLIDWVEGGTRLTLNGAVHPSGVRFGYRFDAAVSSPSGRFTALFERRGTKALLLDRGKLSRELNRSYYCADAYEFPIAFLPLPDGAEAIAHCPRDYCRIDIEVAETGQYLTHSPDRRPTDIFHSRLAASPGGAWLVSAGWVWHPFDVACLWPVEAALTNPTVLDKSAIRLSLSDEVQSVAFLNDDLLAIAAGKENLDDVPSKEESFYILRTHNGSVLRHHRLSFAAGTLVPLTAELVLALHDHPRLLNTSDGRVVWEWPHLDTGKQTSSIIHHLDSLPPFAKHPSRRMFAVADAEKVTVVTLT